jgi:hypothetical protein
MLGISEWLHKWELLKKGSAPYVSEQQQIETGGFSAGLSTSAPFYLPPYFLQGTFQP